MKFGKVRFGEAVRIAAINHYVEQGLYKTAFDCMYDCMCDGQKTLDEKRNAWFFVLQEMKNNGMDFMRACMELDSAICRETIRIKTAECSPIVKKFVEEYKGFKSGSPWGEEVYIYYFGNYVTKRVRVANRRSNDNRFWTDYGYAYLSVDLTGDETQFKCTTWEKEEIGSRHYTINLKTMQKTPTDRKS